MKVLNTDHVKLSSLYDEFLNPLGTILNCQSRGLLFASTKKIETRSILKFCFLTEEKRLVEFFGLACHWSTNRHPQTGERIFEYGVAPKKPVEELNALSKSIFKSIMGFK